jgi:hypothetical protein
MPRRSLRRAAMAAPAACVLAAVAALPAHAGLVGSQVLTYTPGDNSAGFQDSSAALGAPDMDTGTDSSGFSYGALTPFNPPFLSEQVLKIGAGGNLTLSLSGPIAVAPAAQLGIFVNNGLIDVSSGGSGVAGDPAQTFTPAPQAIVSVSDDNLSYITLDANPSTTDIDPFVFDNPTNSYTDTTISGYFSRPGTHPADPFQPFTGHLSDFNALSYPQILDLLDGSAGGNWIDLSASGLSSVQYVKFEVPQGAGYRMVLDAVTAVPEPASLSLAGAATLLVLRRRRAKVS